MYKHNNGSMIIECIIGGSAIMLVIMGLIQMIFLYQGTIQLQQATFEAARAGIVKNGTRKSIKNGFIQNIIDLHGGGQTTTAIAQSYGKAFLAVNTPLIAGGAGFKLRILNPTLEAFDDWGTLNTHNKRVIDNTWLDAKPSTIGKRSGVSIQDANILKIEITYGLPVIMPIIDKIIATALIKINPTRIAYYTATPVRLPITSTAIMHMQTDVHEDNPISIKRLVVSKKMQINAN